MNIWTRNIKNRKRLLKLLEQENAKTYACKICKNNYKCASYYTMANHLLYSHNMAIGEYQVKYGRFKPDGRL